MPDVPGPGVPLVSIVIPTYDRPAQLRACLAAIEAAERPWPIEVVVVDDGGAQRLDAVVAPFAASLRARLIRRQNGGPGAARNTGVAEATGRDIVFVDDDCLLDPAALPVFAAALEDAPLALVGGRTVNRLVDNPYASASQAIVDSVYAFYNGDPEHATFFASNNMAVRREAFLERGGFDESFATAAEDRELCDRWRHAGGRLVYRPAAVVHHAHDLTLGRFVRQHLRYGRSAYAYHRARSLRASGRMRDDLRFHATLPSRLTESARGVPAAQAARDTALIGVWQIANATGWASAAAADGARRLAALAAGR